MLVPERTLAKVAARIVPFVFLLYVANFLDRINVSVAALTMSKDLDLSAVAFGFGSGIFFIGYLFFEIPSNLILAKVGARRWIARIMISWGLVSAATMFVRNAEAFYAMRFLLGLAEAGFFAGIIFYLTQWFPERRRAQAIAGFMTAIAIAGVIGTPLSGYLLNATNGIGGLHGWQWLFVIEAIPSIILGVIVYFNLADSPEDAQWLSADERSWLLQTLDDERARAEASGCVSVGRSLRDGRVWLLAFVYFGFVIALYAIAFWTPTVVKAFSGLGNVEVSLVATIPFVCAAIMMVLVGRDADARGASHRYLVVAGFVAALAFVALTFVQQPYVALVALCIATAAIYAGIPLVWTFAPNFLTGSACAAGIALINSIGNLGGFLGPYLTGYVQTKTGNIDAALWILAACAAAAAALALFAPKGDRRLLVERTRVGSDEREG
jgi:MFS family permease